MKQDPGGPSGPSRDEGASGAPATLRVRGPLRGQGALCERILRALPESFGIEESIVEYRQAIEELPTLVAELDGTAVGLLALRLTAPEAYEVHVMAVLEEAQRHGVGRELMRHADEVARAAGARLLHVKTLGPSHPDEGYAASRAFYRAMGFVPLEELPKVWGPDNPCLIMVKPL